jgi:hypothetical protein
MQAVVVVVRFLILVHQAQLEAAAQAAAVMAKILQANLALQIAAAAAELRIVLAQVQQITLASQAVRVVLEL